MISQEWDKLMNPNKNPYQIFCRRFFIRIVIALDIAASSFFKNDVRVDMCEAWNGAWNRRKRGVNIATETEVKNPHAS